MITTENVNNKLCLHLQDFDKFPNISLAAKSRGNSDYIPLYSIVKLNKLIIDLNSSKLSILIDGMYHLNIKFLSTIDYGNKVGGVDKASLYAFNNFLKNLPEDIMIPCTGYLANDSYNQFKQVIAIGKYNNSFQYELLSPTQASEEIMPTPSVDDFVQFSITSGRAY